MLLTQGVLIDHQWVVRSLQFLVRILIVQLFVLLDNSLVLQVHIEKDLVFVVLEYVCITATGLENLQGIFKGVLKWVSLSLDCLPLFNLRHL